MKGPVWLFALRGKPGSTGTVSRRAIGSVPRAAALSAGATLVLTLLTASAACAAVSFKDRMALHPPAARAAALTEVMVERLALTPDQSSAIRHVAEQHASETDEALSQLKRKELKTRLKAIRDARDADFKGILTEEQFEAYLKDKREIMKGMKSRMKGE